MKNLIFTTLILLSASLAYGGHYHVELGKGGSNGYKNCDKQLDESKGTFSLVCSESGEINNIYASLQSSKIKDYTSQNGWVHNIIDLLKMQEKTLKKVNYMVSRLDADIFVLAKLVGDKTVIDIYTGADAKSNEHLINASR